MIISAKNKNNLVVLSAFGWGLFFLCLLISLNFVSPAEFTVKKTVIFFAAPFLFFGFGYHHWTKQRGQESFSILTWLLASVGIGGTWFGISLVTDKTHSTELIDILPIVVGVIHLVLAYWCYQNEEDEKVISSDLNFQEILILYKEISAGKLSNFQNAKYGSSVSDAALQAVKENQLNVIANSINLNVKLEEKLGDHKAVLGLIMDKLSEAYVELDIESKYELFPLFINKSEGDTSHYFHDTDIQKWALNSYEVLLKKDKLNLQNMENEYFSNTPLAKDYPYILGGLHKYIESQKMADQS
jgi:hypothetical protein